MDPLNDEQLLARIKQDDKLAFRTLTDRYLNKVWRLASNILQNKSNAEDVAQEVFISVWNNRQKWTTGEASFSTWLYRVTFNKAIDAKRQCKITYELDEEIPDPCPKADDIVAGKQLQAVFMECMTTLPEKQRVSLLLYYYEGLNVEEICSKLKTTEDSIRSQLKRGKIGLRKALHDRFGDDYWTIQGFAEHLRG